MSKKDKLLFLILVALTSTLMSILLSTIYNKLWIENYIKKEYGDEIIYTKKNSDLTLELLNNLNQYQNDSIGECRNQNAYEHNKGD